MSPLRRVAQHPAAVIAMPLAAAACGLGVLRLAAPTYLSSQGFPLDDAWIHAVYARELARSGILAYNPGMPATGETSPLWALVLAVPHWLAQGDAAIRAAKITGFLLHALAAVLIAIAVGKVATPPVAAAAGALVAFHPDLIAAAVSGMEVPLATLAIACVACACVRERPLLAAAAGAAAFLARPETAVVAVICPLLFFIGRGTTRWTKMTGAAAAGSVAALAVVAARNVWVSGMPLPATFYVKAGSGASFSLAWQRIGFTRVFESMPVMGFPVLVAAVALAAGWLLVRQPDRPGSRLGGALAASALVFCAVSFVLVRPLDPQAFYHQRYVLPALLPILAALPLLVAEMPVPVRSASIAGATVVALLIGWMALAAPARFHRLSNDARNVDDVQVAFGRALGHAAPGDAAWVVDAGAARYFGSAFVVDLMALNTFELLGSEAQDFLDRHPPRYLDAFDGWSSVQMADDDRPAARTFAASTAYTVTSFPGMSRHTLVRCEPAGRRGTIALKTRTYSFACGHSSSAAMR